MKLQIYISDTSAAPNAQSKVRISFQTTGSEAKFDLNFEEFNTAISLGTSSQIERQYSPPMPTMQSIASIGSTNPSTGEEQIHSPLSSLSLTNLLSLLLGNGIDVKQAVLDDLDTVIIIESNHDLVLSLEWEREVAKLPRELKVIRHVMVGASGIKTTSSSNYLFLLSHGYRDGYRELRKVANDFGNEVSPVLTSLFEMNRRGIYKPQLFQVVKYLSQEVLNNVELKNYNNIHLVLHGRENGDLGFEAPTDHWQISWLSAAEFVEQMRASSSEVKDLIFLSCCYSGYGTAKRQSLAFQLVSSGLAKHVIAFNGGVGSERTLPGFVTYFYENYMNTNDIVSAFHIAVGKLKKDHNPYWSKPVLYMRDTA